jgi:RNA polymerase sigma-70 factor, ECF subfamily
MPTEPEEYARQISNPELLRILRGRARNLTRHADTADDLLATTLLKAWQGIVRGQFVPTDESSMRKWTLTLMKHAYVDALDSAARAPATVGLENSSLRRRGSPPVQEEAVLAAELDKIVEAMPAPRRRAFMTMVAGESDADAAKAHGVPVITVRTRIHRARRELAEALAEEQRPKGGMSQFPSAAGGTPRRGR